MCFQAKNVPSVTLQTAVLMQVKDFANAQQTFSVFDITRTIREKTGNGDIEIPEVEVSGASFRFDIPHAKVKAIFDELWRTGVFDPLFTLNRNFNGTYFEYTPQIAGNVSATPAPVPTFAVTPSAPVLSVSTAPTTTATSSGKPSRSDVTPRVKLYLDNCASRNFRPTLKQVQSAIKRGDVSTGWTCDELSDLIENDLGFNVVPDPDYVSASQVEVV